MERIDDTVHYLTAYVALYLNVPTHYIYEIWSSETALALGRIAHRSLIHRHCGIGKKELPLPCYCSRNFIGSLIRIPYVQPTLKWKPQNIPNTYHIKKSYFKYVFTYLRKDVLISDIYGKSGYKHYLSVEKYRIITIVCGIF